MAYKKTKTVKAVQEYIENNGTLNAASLVKHFQTIMNKVTIYRILSRLENEGIIHSFLDDKGSMCYAKCFHCTPNKHEDHHAHFLCSRCGKKICLDTNVTVNSEFQGVVDKEIVLLKGQCEDCTPK